MCLGWGMRSRWMLIVSMNIREKHIVLLGEAGCGKSIALNQLSSAASNTQYYPLLYNLNNYTDNSIEEIVFSVYPEVDLEADKSVTITTND